MIDTCALNTYHHIVLHYVYCYNIGRHTATNMILNIKIKNITGGNHGRIFTIRR